MMKKILAHEKMLQKEVVKQKALKEREDAVRTGVK